MGSHKTKKWHIFENQEIDLYTGLPLEEIPTREKKARGKKQKDRQKEEDAQEQMRKYQTAPGHEEGAKVSLTRSQERKLKRIEKKIK